MTLILVGLVAASLVLAVVAIVMWRRVWQQRAQQAQALEMAHVRAAQTEQERLAYIHESVHVIATAVLEGQCPLPEGCLRLAVLLDNLPLGCDEKHALRPLFEVYERIRHVPTHTDFRTLERKERQRFKQLLFQVEQSHGEAVHAALKALLAQPLPGMTRH